MGKPRDCEMCGRRCYRRRFKCGECGRLVCEANCAVRRAGKPAVCRDCYIQKREVEIARDFPAVHHSLVRRSGAR